MTIYTFAKLNMNEREEMIQKQGVFLESWIDNDNLINLFYVDGFFVEIALNPLRNEPVSIIPFKRGYNVKTYHKQLYNHFKHVFETLKLAA
jgi:hypothetical protein